MNEILEKVDKLYEAGHMVEALGTIIDHKGNLEPEVQWRLARSIFKEGEFKSSDEKHAAIKSGLDILDRNLDLHPKCWNSHLWHAIILGSKDKHESFKQKIEEAFVIESHLKECLSINPDCALAYHVLGHWRYQVASVSWLQKKTAATLFATPPESTLEEALDAFLKAEKLTEGKIFNNNHLFSAKVLLDMGKKDEAKVYIKKTFDIAEEKKNDKETLDNIESAKKMGKKLGMKL